MKPNKVTVGKRIHEIRTSLGYSMEEFGKLIGDSPRSSVNNWEKGISIPKKDKLEKIALLGNTSSEKVLYGSLNEYLFNLVKQNLHIELNDQLINMILMAASPHQLSYDDDIKWLEGVKKILDLETAVYQPAELFYTLIDQTKRLYIGQIYVKEGEVEQSNYQDDFKPIFYVFTDNKQNSLHLIPFSFNEQKEQLYFKSPTFIEEPGKHSYFTNQFETLGLELEQSLIIYYGLKQNNLKEDIQLYSYDKQNDCYKKTEEMEIDYCPFFKEELRKEQLILKN